MQSWNCGCDVGVSSLQPALPRAPWSNIPRDSTDTSGGTLRVFPSPAPVGPCSSSQPLFLQPQCPECFQTLGSAPPAVPAARGAAPRGDNPSTWTLGFGLSSFTPSILHSWQRMHWIVSTETFLTCTTRGSQSQGILGAFL